MDAKPHPLNITQVYMPTTTHEDEEVLDINAELQRVVDRIPKKERLILIGDFNAQIGEGIVHPACGKF